MVTSLVLACCALKQLYLAEPARFFQSILTAYPFNRGFRDIWHLWRKGVERPRPHVGLIQPHLTAYHFHTIVSICQLSKLV